MRHSKLDHLSAGGLAEVDMVVVGSGIAGLFAAINALDAGQRVVIVTKSDAMESNTRYAQGGIAVALDESDSPARHALDTVACGGGLNFQDAVSVLTGEAGGCLECLLDLGVEFDREEDALALTREAGHAVPRVIHAGGDATGFAIQRALVDGVRRRGGLILEHFFAADLLMSGDCVAGVMLFPQECFVAPMKILFSPRVLLASGGAGRIFARTTNPAVATGDGVAAAYRAGAELMDLEFFQFHPTALAAPGSPAFLISEAARGEGGVLRDGIGRRAFMREYDDSLELAPRDVVSRAIWSEMIATETDHVFLDLTMHSSAHLRHRFPTIFETCSRAGIDISEELIPVAPAAHYFMGGVKTDLYGRTSIRGLLAVGEVAATGVHGANRMASNSLLEGLVFGRRAAMVTDSVPLQLGHQRDGSLLAHTPLETAEGKILDVSTLRRANWQHLGIVREREGLESHADRLGTDIAPLDPWASSADGPLEMSRRNLLLLSQLMTRAALIREESRGAHYRADFPEQDDRWRGNIVMSRERAWFTPTAAPARDAVSA